MKKLFAKIKNSFNGGSFNWENLRKALPFISGVGIIIALIAFNVLVVKTKRNVEKAHLDLMELKYEILMLRAYEMGKSVSRTSMLEYVMNNYECIDTLELDLDQLLEIEARLENDNNVNIYE